MNPDTIFGRIARGEVEADKVYENDLVVAFRDANPQAPVHVLVIPREPYETAADLAEADPALAGEVLRAASEVAKVTGIDKTGYRLVFNTGSDGQQTVPHVHCHVIGGRQLTWPPG